MTAPFVDTQDSFEIPAPAGHGGGVLDESTADHLDDLTPTSVDQLIIGRTLRFPIYDAHRVLLLAEGNTITLEVKEHLRKWSNGSVLLHHEDVGHVAPDAGGNAQRRVFRDERTQELDEIIESGLLCTVNTGPAVRDALSPPTCADYDHGMREQLLDQHKSTSTLIADLMHRALHGQSVDMDRVSRVALEYVSSMRCDLDNVLSTVFSKSADEGLANHCVRTGLLGMAMGIEMGLDEENVRRVGVAGFVHDWGMARVPDEIRLAHRILTDEEFLEVVKHPIYSVEILKRCRNVPCQVPLISYQVHERPNGNGYPRQRTANEILLPARILSVADTYQALVSPRPFRRPLCPYAAMECLIRQAHSHDLDPQSVRALLRILSLFPVGSYVMLDDESIARVLRHNPEDYTRPIVRTVQDQSGKNLPPEMKAAIFDLQGAGRRVRHGLATPGTDETELNEAVLEVRHLQDISGWGCPQASEPTQADARDDSDETHAEGENGGTEHVSFEYYTEGERRSAFRAIELANRCSARYVGRYREARRHSRTAIRTVVYVCPTVPGNASSVVPRERVFRALARDVSQGGLCFLHPELLASRHILLGVDLPDGQRHWFQAEIVRRREIASERFWEYGVALNRRVVA